MFFTLNPNKLSAQTIPEGYIAIWTTDATFNQIPDSNRSNNMALNALLDYYQVDIYKKFFNQDSLIPYLEDQYIVSGIKGNVSDLDSALRLNGNIYRVTLFKYAGAKLLCNIAVSHNDPYFDPLNTSLIFSKWHLEKVEAACAWFLSQGNPDLKVALVDVNIKSNHPELTNKINFFTHLDDSAFASVPKITNNYHGTQTAGFIAAETNNNLGIGSLGHDLKLEVFEVNIYNGSPSLSTNELRDGIWQAYLRGNKVISCSFAGNGFAILSYEDAKTITESGTILVLGAGNDRISSYSNDWAYLLGSLPGVIIVSATNADDEHGPTNYSYHDKVDLCAPGYDVITTDEISSYHYVNGTSFATPMVAATVGLMLSIDPNISVEEIECILKSTCDPIADNTSGNAWFGKLGGGRLNAYKALLEVKTRLDIGKKGLINANATWTSNVSIIEDITVEAGTTLIIENANVEIRSGKTIFVEPGAILRITNSTLNCFDNCGVKSLWGGIIVLGHGDNSPQIIGGIYNQGLLILANATVENALTGIQSGTSNLNSGGILKIGGSTIKNCRVDIKFQTYLNSTNNESNLSFISNSNFICDDTIRGFNNEGSLFCIWMTSVRGIVISGNHFINSIDDINLNLIGNVKRGTAISAWESKFKVTPSFDYSVIINNPGSCPRYPLVRKSHFEGFTKAISSHASDPVNHNMDVLEADFVNNEINIDFNNAQYPIIYNNHFTWDNNLRGLISGNNMSCKGVSYKNDGNNQVELMSIFDNLFESNLYNNMLNFKSIQIIESLNPTSGSLSNRANKIVQNKYFSNSPLTDHTAIFFANNCLDYIVNCDYYNENIRFGWYADLNTELYHSLALKEAYSNAINGDGNQFDLCKNSPPNPNNPNRSIKGLGSTFINVPNAGSPISWVRFSEYPVLDPNCLQNTNNSSPFKPINPYCNANGLAYTYAQIYCPGPDKIPGTGDDGSSGNGGDNGGGNPPCNPCNFEELSAFRNKMFSLLKEKGIDATLAKSISQSELLYDQAIFLSKMDSTIESKIIRDYLHHFYGILITEKDPKNNIINKLDKNDINVISSDFIISPNPTNNEFKIEFIGKKEANEFFQMKISDLQGTLVKEDNNFTTTTINIRDLPSGAYYITIWNKNGIFTKTKKIIKL